MKTRSILQQLLVLVFVLFGLGFVSNATSVLKSTASNESLFCETNKCAIATLLTVADYGYLSGAEAISIALRSFGTKLPFVCLVASAVFQSSYAPEFIQRLQIADYEVIPIEPIVNPNQQLERQWFQTTYSKLHIWNLTQYDKILYLDLDTLVLKNLDHLFDRNFESLAAAPDSLPPDKFQSGVMMLKPNANTFRNMSKMISSLNSYDGGDQGFLNSYFEGWYESSSSSRLPFHYNTLQTTAHLYPPAWNHLHQNQLIHVLHFSGDPPNMKPWAEGQRVVTPNLAPYLYVWRIFSKAAYDRRQYFQRKLHQTQTTTTASLIKQLIEEEKQQQQFFVDDRSVQSVLTLSDPNQIQQLFSSVPTYISKKKSNKKSKTKKQKKEKTKEL